MKSFHWTAALVSLALVQACSGSAESERDAAIDSYVQSAGRLSVAEEQAKHEVECNDLCPASGQEGDQFCSYHRYQQTEHSDQFVALQPNSASLWPGNVVRGGDASVGLLTPLGLKQAPLTFSISLENLKADKSSATMKSPSLSAFRDMRNDILGKGMSGSTPAAINLSIAEVKSLDDVAFKLGAGLKWPGANKIAATFNFDSTTKKSKILVDFTQAYYTIDVDSMAKPSDFFEKSVSVDDIKGVVGAGNPPLYIQSITYGRRVIFAIETASSLSDVKLALDAAYGSGKVGVDGSVDADKKSTLDTSSIQAFVLGGDSDDAVGVVSGFDGVVSYIKKGGNYAKTSPGAPIAYKLAYLDNTVTQLAFTTDYADRACVKNRGTLHVGLDGLTVSGGDKSSYEIRGGLWVAAPTFDADGNIVPLPDNCEDLRADDTAWNEVWFKDNASFVAVEAGKPWSPEAGTAVFDIPNVAFGADQHLCVDTFFATTYDDFLSGTRKDDQTLKTRKKVLFGNGWDGVQTIGLSGTGDLTATFKVKLGSQTP